MKTLQTILNNTNVQKYGAMFFGIVVGKIIARPNAIKNMLIFGAIYLPIGAALAFIADENLTYGN
jgi:hypothetical protein